MGVTTSQQINVFAKSVVSNSSDNITVRDGRVAVSNGMSTDGNDVHVLLPLTRGEAFR